MPNLQEYEKHVREFLTNYLPIHNLGYVMPMTVNVSMAPPSHLILRLRINGDGRRHHSDMRQFEPTVLTDREVLRTLRATVRDARAQAPARYNRRIAITHEEARAPITVAVMAVLRQRFERVLTDVAGSGPRPLATSSDVSAHGTAESPIITLADATVAVKREVRAAVQQRFEHVRTAIAACEAQVGVAATPNVATRGVPTIWEQLVETDW